MAVWVATLLIWALWAVVLGFVGAAWVQRRRRRREEREQERLMREGESPTRPHDRYRWEGGRWYLVLDMDGVLDANDRKAVKIRDVLSLKEFWERGHPGWVTGDLLEAVRMGPGEVQIHLRGRIH